MTNLAWLVLSLIIASDGFAQYSYTPNLASGCLDCNGSLTIDLDQSADYVFSLFTPGNPIATEVVSGTGNQLFLSDLCPGNYEAELQIGVDSFSFPVSIGTVANNPGPGGFIYLCTTAINVNLNNFLGGADPGGTWTDPFGQVHASNFAVNVDPEGSYTYTVDDGNCQLSSVWEVVVNTPADPGNATTYLICENYPPFELFDALFGSPEPGGNWYRPGNIPDDGTYDTATEDGGIYIYEIDSVLGCANVYNTLFIIENQLPDPGESAAVGVCPDAFPFDMSIYLGGTPDAGGQWQNAANQDVDAIFDPLVDLPGTYEYTIIGATPCPTLSSTLTITYTDGIDAGEDATLDICETGSSVNLLNALNGNPDPDGLWINPQGEFFDGILDPSVHPSGDYQYLVQAAGCQDEMSTVSVNIVSNVNAGQGQVIQSCAPPPSLDLNELLSADADANGTWLDSFGSTIDPVVPVIVGANVSYTYLVAGGVCPDSQANFELEFLQTAQAGPDLVLNRCDTAGPLDLMDFVSYTGPLQTELLNQELEPIDSIVEPAPGVTSFNYVVISENTCPSDTAIVVVNVQEQQYPDILEALNVCSSDPLIALDLLLPNGFPEPGVWTYNGSILEPAAVDPDEFNEGLYSFQADSLGFCPGPLFELELSIAPLADAGNGGFIQRCLNEEAIDLLSLPDADATPGGEWFFDGVLVSSPDFIPLGDGTLSYIIDQGAPCPSVQADWQIDVLPLPEFDAGNDISGCSGENPIEIGQAPQADYIYLWSPSSGLSDNQSANPMLVLSNSGEEELSIAYTVQVSDGTCSTTDTLLVDVYPLPQVDLGGDVGLCDGETVSFNFPSEFEVSISPSDWEYSIEGNNLTVMPESSGLFELSVQNDFGCSAGDVVEVELYPLPDVDFNVFPAVGCPPLTIELFNQSENQEEHNYYWMLGEDVYTTDAVLQIEESGIYDLSLFASSELGCENVLTQDAAVEVYPDPLAGFDILPENPTAYTSQIEIINTSSLELITNWYLNSELVSTVYQPEFEIPIIEDASYQVCQELINAFQCRDTLCKDVLIQGDFTLYVPNAFTPNADGKNELFIPVIRGMDIDHYEFQVYNRWGEQIFATEDPGTGWYGNVNGGDYYAMPGVYVWQLKIRNKYTGNDILERGSVTLIR